MKRKGHARTTSPKSSAPAWLSGSDIISCLRAQRQDRSPELQLNGDQCVDEDGAGGGRRHHHINERTQSQSQQRSGETIRGAEEVLDERTGIRTRRVRVTFRAIRDALSDDDLFNLLKSNYANRLVTLDVYTPKTDEDDLFVETAPIKPTRVLSSKSIPPSERHIEAIERYQNNGVVDEETLLAFYFILFKRFFKEEDPYWVGKTSTGAINQIHEFVSLHTTYPDALLFLQKLFPLWVKRLKDGAKFPTNRPSLNNFFPSGEKKYFWTNRNLLYRQWKESPVTNDDQD